MLKPCGVPAAVSGPSASEGAADSSNRGGIIKATPAVRTLAKEMGIDLSLLSGTGPDGRIVENDLRRVFGCFDFTLLLTCVRCHDEH